MRDASGATSKRLQHTRNISGAFSKRHRVVTEPVLFCQICAECTCFESFTSAPRECRNRSGGCSLVETVSRAMSALAALDIAIYVVLMTLFFVALRRSRRARRRPVDRAASVTIFKPLAGSD